MDSVYNRSLFQAKSRDARNKLSRMGGIMSSSSELMEAAMPQQPAAMPPAPAMPAPPTGAPMQMPMQQAPMYQDPMQMYQDPMQMYQQPMPMPMPMPMQQPPQMRMPMAAPQQQAPVMMAEGGDTTLEAYMQGTRMPSATKFVPVDIGQGPMSFLSGLRQEAAKLQPEGGEAVLDDKLATIQAAADTGDQEVLKDAITGSVGVENTKTGLEDAAVELTDTTPDEAQNLSIDELNDRIMAVALNGSLAAPGSMAERYAKAMIFGLGQKRETAMARAAAKTGGGGSGFSPLEPYADAVRDLAGKLVTATGVDLADAIAQAEAALRPLYTGGTGGVAVPTDGATSSANPTLDEFLEKAQAANPNATTEELTAYYNQTYGG
jgi:hypothetical protein